MASKRHHGSKKRKPAQQRYRNENRAIKNKERRAQKYANKFNCNVIIKIIDKLFTVKPKGEN